MGHCFFWFILMTDLMLELILIWVIIPKQHSMQMIFTDFEKVINMTFKNMNGFLLICIL